MTMQLLRQGRVCPSVKATPAESGGRLTPHGCNEGDIAEEKQQEVTPLPAPQD